MNVSIIVTTKNRPDFLYRCLLAISKQTCKNYECIVVGDHCNYAENVCKLFDVNFIDHRGTEVKNVGAVGKNIGIEAAKYDRICYCDDDNILLPDHIKAFDRVKGALLVSKFIEVKYGNAETYEILNRPLYDIPNGSEGHSDALTICHSKTLWKKVGKWKPAAEVGRNEDRDFIQRLDGQAAKVLIPQVTAIYNSHEKSFDEYNKLLPTANPIVYPELIPVWI